MDKKNATFSDCILDFVYNEINFNDCFSAKNFIVFGSQLQNINPDTP
jgi:hypothetical protein